MVKALSFLIDLFFPPRCMFCRSYLPSGTDSPFCTACRLTVALQPGHTLSIPAGSCLYALKYVANVRRAIISYKFHNKPQYAKALGELLVPLLTPLAHIDCITWAPVSALRLSKRGYDQSRLLAETVGHTLGIPVYPLLRKHRHTRKQSQTAREKRAENIRGAYVCATNHPISGLRIVLIDDVVTTGSTLSECCRVLYAAGAKEVVCVALAH